ncbi:nuclease-related domain-containing protein [Robertmurraya sp. GLU-23]
MIVKELTVPLKLQAVQCLEKRILSTHHQYPQILADLAKRKAGYYGERSLCYYFHQLPPTSYLFHNLRLEQHESIFEMDVLILFPTFALIIETKNIIGEIHFDSQFGQLIRTWNDKKEAFPDPIAQARRHQSLMGDWLFQQLGYSMPVEYLIVVSNSSTIISTDPGKAYLFKQVIHANKLPLRLTELQSKYKTEMMETSQLKKLSRKLLKDHKEAEYDVLKKFQIQADELVKGVQCPSCQLFRMQRKKGRWTCMNCGHSDRLAHLEALHDYWLLISPTITNAKCRDFLQIDSPFVASRLLKSLHLSESGTLKGKKYHFPKKMKFFPEKK